MVGLRVRWKPIVAILLLGAGLAACAPAPTGQAADAPASTTPAPPADTLPPPPSETAAPTATQPGPTATPAPPTPLPPRPEQIGPESYPEGINPLTGLAPEDPSVLNRRPLLVKISNAPEIVRPQSGIGSADLMFEYYVEGGWTRFATVFYSDGADHLGAVRSARLPDLQLAPAFDAILVFSGASRGVTDTIRDSDLYPYDTISPQFGVGEPQFVRFPREGLPLEHTMFSDTALLWQHAEERGTRMEPRLGTPGFAFHALPPYGGTPASAFTFEYVQTKIEWRYDPVSGRYLRWTDGIPHTDATTEEQLAFENVVTMGSTLELVYLYEEKYGEEEDSLYIELTGWGPATLFRDGQAFVGRWERPTEDSAFRFVMPDGSPMLFKPGKTFFQIGRTGEEEPQILP